MWDGSIRGHETDDYPHDPADRTQEEQAIMGQVEARAKYVAQREFPDEDILDPLWDPDHLERGVEALVNYTLGEFRTNFRDYYEALQRPEEFVPDDPADIDEATLRIYKSFTITEDNRIDEVYDTMINYDLEDGTFRSVGDAPDDWSHAIDLNHPKMEFDPNYDFDAQFHRLIVEHLHAQIRDVHYNMGMEPPDEYKVSGFGKFSYHGDGIDTRPHTPDA
ncbi:hypothetical protein [Halococcoides cellulosivorans]|nr:hypothetical protein [Halococcoides cellulosivorans]